MKMFERFKGDSVYSVIHGIQNGMYENMVGYLFGEAKLSISKIVHKLGYDDKILLLLNSDIDHFDHRTLQGAHDLIAAIYRLRFDSEQLELNLYTYYRLWPHLEEQFKDVINNYPNSTRTHIPQWWNYFTNTCREFCEDIVFAMEVLKASLLFPNSDIGYQAERNIKILIASKSKVLIDESGLYILYPIKHVDGGENIT